MLFAVVGLSILIVLSFGLFVFLFSHIKGRDEWMRAWVGEVYKRHNSLYELVREVRGRVYEVERELAFIDTGSRLSPGGLRGQYSRADAGRSSADNTGFDTACDSDDGNGNGTSNADTVTDLTSPYTLRECCADNRPNDCPSWRVIGSLCIELWSADQVR